MKPATAVSMAVLLALAAAAAVAAPPQKIETQAVRDLAKMPVEELQKLQPPPGARAKMHITSAAIQAAVGTGPDLVVVPPAYATLGYGTSLGFAGANYPGFEAIFDFKNQGHATAPAGWKVNVACEVLNVPPGTPQYAFYQQRWCSYAEGVYTYSQQIWAGATTPGSPPFVKTFTGYPLPSCSQLATAPHPHTTVTVDYTNAVAEGAVGETNNVFEGNLCLPY